MKLSDYVVDVLIQRGLRHIFLLPGGGCMHLADSVGKRPELDYVCCLHEQGCAFAAEAYGAKGIAPNVDFYSGLVYQKLGMEIDLFTPFFAIARVSGWGAHFCEQLSNNRIYRPTQKYVGTVNATYTPMSER